MSAISPTDPTLSGRWSHLPAQPVETEVRMLALTEAMLTRYGVVTRPAALVEDPPGGFSGVYRVLAKAEESGLVRRGYFIDHLGAAQFATAAAIDALRATRNPASSPEAGDSVESHPLPAWIPPAAGSGGARAHRGSAALVLAAADPANPFGAALSWPPSRLEHAGHRPGRKAGAMVVIYRGSLLAYLERGGKTVLTWDPPGQDLWEPTDAWDAAADVIAGLVSNGQVDALTIKTMDGVSALSTESALKEALLRHGFHISPQGLRKRR